MLLGYFCQLANRCMYSRAYAITVPRHSFPTSDPSVQRPIPPAMVAFQLLLLFLHCSLGTNIGQTIMLRHLWSEALIAKLAAVAQ